MANIVGPSVDAGEMITPALGVRTLDVRCGSLTVIDLGGCLLINSRGGPLLGGSVC